MSTIEKIFDAPLTGYDILNERRTMHIFCFSSQSRKQHYCEQPQRISGKFRQVLFPGNHSNFNLIKLVC